MNKYWNCYNINILKPSAQQTILNFGIWIGETGYLVESGWVVDYQYISSYIHGWKVHIFIFF